MASSIQPQMEVPTSVQRTPSTDISTLGGVDTEESSPQTYTDDDYCNNDEEYANTTGGDYGGVGEIMMPYANQMGPPNDNNNNNNSSSHPFQQTIHSTPRQSNKADPQGLYNPVEDSGMWSPSLMQWSPQPKMSHPNLAGPSLYNDPPLSPDANQPTATDTGNNGEDYDNVSPHGEIEEMARNIIQNDDQQQQQQQVAAVNGEARRHTWQGAVIGSSDNSNSNNNNNNVESTLNNSNDAQYNGDNTLLNDTLNVNMSNTYSSSSSSDEGGIFGSGGPFRPSSRAVKYLCIGSIVLVVTALGLAATGIGIMMSDNNSNEIVPENEDAYLIPGAELPRVDDVPIIPQAEPVQPTQEQLEMLESMIESGVIDEEQAVVVEGEEEEANEEEEDGPKAKLTDESTPSPVEEDVAVGPLGVSRPGASESQETGEATQDTTDGVVEEWWQTTEATAAAPVEEEADEPILAGECRRNGQCESTELCLLDTGDCSGRARSGVCVALWEYEMCTFDINPVW